MSTKQQDDIELYLAKTGQTMQYLFSGAATYGMPFIGLELVPRALRENKKIVWYDVRPELGIVEYKLKDI